MFLHSRLNASKGLSIMKANPWLRTALLLALPALAHAQEGQRPEVTAAAQRLRYSV